MLTLQEMIDELVESLKETRQEAIEREIVQLIKEYEPEIKQSY